MCEYAWKSRCVRTLRRDVLEDEIQIRRCTNAAKYFHFLRCIVLSSNLWLCVCCCSSRKKGWHRLLYLPNRSLLKYFASDHNNPNVNVYHRRIVLLQRCHSLADFCHHCWTWKMCQSSTSQSTSTSHSFRLSFASSRIRSQFCAWSFLISFRHNCLLCVKTQSAIESETKQDRCLFTFASL